MSERVSLVMVPVDGSAQADAATRHAALLAYLLDATLQLVHVLPLHPAEFSDLPGNRQAEADHDRRAWEASASRAFTHAREHLASLPFSAQLRIEAQRLSDESFVPHPERVIVDHARRHDKALLVMGARHLSEVGKWVKGSVSNAVVHRAKGPVTVIHPGASILDTATIGCILLPVDGSPHSDVAARLAGDLARSGAIRVELLFCQPPGEMPLLDSGESEASRVFRHTQRVLGDVPAGVTETLLRAERYANAIVAQARSCPDNPVIIMGRRGMSSLQASLLGSVSHKVIEQAPCPVTVVV
ncbi:universal stress protein [Halomonas dongshanensis]|uniref:Universal stress protein n=1 Tax=Halomonas dongshanensis TaxID=2890835 RepID=A0ABT2EAX6_9GAMM|nr:universal stress protein [Halomonas dongshanensis]MCS2608700.1 universal stress protein [Halomonas dongshanensis]